MPERYHPSKTRLVLPALLGLSACASWHSGIRGKEQAYENACQEAEKRSEDKAITECRRCLKLMPDDETCSEILYAAKKRASQKHYTHALTLHEQGRYREAQEEFDASAALNPDKMESGTLAPQP